MNIRSITAPNPGPFTLDGTRTYLIDETIVVDPGPDIASHVDAIARAMPNLRTILKWSARDSWVETTARYDAEVAAELRARMRQVERPAPLDWVAALERVAQQCLEDVVRIRLSGAGTAADKKALITAAIDCIKMVEVLTGGVTERKEQVAGLAEEARVALRRLEARRRGTPPEPAPGA